MQNTKDTLLMPSPALYGYQMAEKLILNEIHKTNPNLFAEQLSLLIQTTDFSVTAMLCI